MKMKISSHVEQGITLSMPVSADRADNAENVKFTIRSNWANIRNFSTKLSGNIYKISSIDRG